MTVGEGEEEPVMSDAAPIVREVTRVEGFSDAVFGFAITLLVVSLEVPSTFDALLGVLRGAPVFAACFALLLLIWHEHHQFFRRFGLQDGMTIWLNGLLLFIVMLYIYPLKFLFAMLGTRGTLVGEGSPMMRGSQMPTLMLIYGLGFALVFAALACMYLHAYRTTPPAGADADDRHWRTDAALGVGHSLVYVVVGLLSIVVAHLGSHPIWGALAGVTYGTVGPLQAIYHRATRRYRAAA